MHCFQCLPKTGCPPIRLWPRAGMYLPIFSETSVRDFCMTARFQKQPKNFWQFCKYIWPLLKIFSKIFQLPFNISIAPIWSSCLVPTIKMQSESNSFSVFWYTWDTQSTLHAFLEYFKDMELNFFYWSWTRTKSSGCVSQTYM